MNKRVSRVAQIIALQNQIIEVARTGLEMIILLGGLLAEEKKRLGHGNWLLWVEKNLPFSERTARNYISCFKGRDRLKSASVADLTEAYRLVTHWGEVVGKPFLSSQCVTESQSSREKESQRERDAKKQRN